MVFAVVDDVIFLSKILETARIMGLAVHTAGAEDIVTQARAHPGCAFVVDLNHRSGRVVDQIQQLKSNPDTTSIMVVGFLSHVQTELAVSARAAGCDIVLARSGFVKQLPELLTQLAGPQSEASPA